ncbi:arylesterase [Rhizobium sp. KVB221]|uniref:Arylesterase n=1 Tax=Rhizobium setariae TaxID=2801340 RepID=A0A936YTJ6_9HYPH|nr:arylesterase [Rhizobium setariae]MBL0374651.1 arylesterase [Rhizobium setariae]
MTFKALGRAFFAVTLFALAAAKSEAQTISIVGFGDSLMAGYELPPEEAFAAQLESLLKARGHDVTITNAGVSGDTTADGLARLDWSIPDGTKGVILELGANDALRGLSPEESQSNLDAMLTRLKQRNIPVLLAGMVAPPNMGADYEAKFNPIYKTLAEKYGVMLYPFFLDGVAMQPELQLKDGMHPNGQGTKRMAEKFLPVAEAFLKNITR